MADAKNGSTDETRWMSYSELANAQGISKASAARLASRRSWMRQADNDGTVRVAVPVAELAGARRFGLTDPAADS
jgi:uncharacterized protein YdbL (DUF1318 family)